VRNDFGVGIAIFNETAKMPASSKTSALAVSQAFSWAADQAFAKAMEKNALWTALEARWAAAAGTDAASWKNWVVAVRAIYVKAWNDKKVRTSDEWSGAFLEGAAAVDAAIKVMK
jgi:hypothetical protein